MTVIAIGAHPDDPEEGAGGTLARLAAAGETLIVVYVTSGGRGIREKPPEDAVRIREAEARNACALLGAEPRFLGLPDGRCFPAETAVQELRTLFEEAKPRAILTCWPLDTHPDHRATGYMVMEAYARIYGNYFPVPPRDPFAERAGDKEPPGLFFWATSPWGQSLQFSPSVLVNIDATMDAKLALIRAHVSQNSDDGLARVVVKTAQRLGERSAGSIRHAEGFMSARPGFVSP